MNMTQEDIRIQIGQEEGTELEYKSAKGGFPDSFWETFSAFANTHGGIIVLGMKEKNGKLYADGLDDTLIAKYKKNFWDCAHNKGKVSATMLTDRDVTVEEINSVRFLVFRIPKAAYDLKPVYLNGNPLKNTYRRNHEGDYLCTESEVRLMMADAESQKQSWDSKLLPNYTIEDIDTATLRAYRQRFLMRHENHPWNDLDDMKFLTKIGAYHVNREDGTEGFTRAGILMLGKTESIQDSACAPQYFVDYQEKLSSDPMLRWTDRLYPDGTWEANLYQFFYKTYLKLTQLLPTPFILKGIDRQEESSAHIALREALANSLIHCNFAQQGNVLIVGRTGSISMRNPGCMLISIDEFYAGSHSICRNPILQKLFMFLGYGEKAGSGADIIKKGWEDNHWPMPVLTERVQPEETLMTFTITSQETSQEIMSAVTGNDKIPQETSQDIIHVVTENRQTSQETIEATRSTSQKILELVKKNGRITTQEMANRLGIDRRNVARNIKKLQEEGRLRRIGATKNGYWLCIEDAEKNA